MLNSTVNSKNTYNSHNSQYRRSFINSSQKNNIYVKKIPTKFRKMLVNRTNKQQRRFLTQGQQVIIDSIYHHQDNNKQKQHSYQNSNLLSNNINKTNSKFNSIDYRQSKQTDFNHNHQKYHSLQTDKQKQTKDIKSFVKNLKYGTKDQQYNKRNSLNQFNDIPVTLLDSQNNQNPNYNKDFRANNKNRSPTSFSLQSHLSQSHVRNVQSSMGQQQKYKPINSNRSKNQDKLFQIEANIDQIIRNKLFKFAQRQKINNTMSKTSDINTNNFQNRLRQNNNSSLSNNKRSSSSASSPFHNQILNQNLIKSTRQFISKPSIYKIKMRDTAQDLILDVNNQDLSKLIQQLRQIKEDDQNRKNEDIIMILNKKIQMIQKIMAENSLESEAMKKYYFARISQRKISKNLTLLKSLQTKNSSIKPPNYLKNTKSIKIQSISRRSFKAPKSSDYNLDRYKHKPFQYNLQPFPRSSYNRDYLKYSQLKQKNESCKKKDFKFTPDKDHYKHQSIYSADYQNGNKIMQINYKQLDAYRDKFKDLQVSYNPENKIIKAYQEQKYLKKKNLQALKMKEELLKTSLSNRRCQTLIQDLSNSRLSQPNETQNHRQFKGLNGPASIIKNKALQKLKYSFRQITKI